MRRLATLLVLLSAGAHAQSGEPGYVVAQGDTVRAEVEIGTEFNASRGLRYRTAGGAWQQAGPPDVEAFGTDAGRRYRRRLLRLSPDRPDDSPTPAERLAFARVVRDGPASLLALEVTPSRPLYVVEVGAGDPVGLYRIQDQVMRPDGFRRQRDVALYRQTLATVLAGCDVDAARVESLPYTEDALAAVVDDYNRCRNPDYRRSEGTTARRRRSRLTLEVGAGFASSSFHRQTPPPFDYADPNQTSAQVRVAAEWSPGALPPAITFLLGLEYDRSLIKHVDNPLFGGRTRVERDGIVASLGPRLTLDAAGTPVYVGGGILNGTLISGRGRDPDSISDLTAEGYIANVTPRFLSSFGGVSAEAGVRPLGGRVGLGVQYRATVFSSSGIYIPGNRENRYGLRTLSLTASARL